VKFVSDCIGQEAENARSFKIRRVLLENLRFHSEEEAGVAFRTISAH
jgi:3-phosphoglycerate kinase